MGDRPPSVVEFLSSSWPTAWIRHGKIDSYLRKSTRMIEGRRLRVLDIANSSVSHEKHMRKGHYKAFHAHVEEVTPGFAYEAIYHENVLNVHLEAFLLREGYVILPGVNSALEGIHLPCLYKLI